MATDAEIIEKLEQYLDRTTEERWQELLDALQQREHFAVLDEVHSGFNWLLVIALTLVGIFWALIANTVTLWLT